MNTIEIDVWIEEIGKHIIAEIYVTPEQIQTFDQERIEEEIEVISTNHEYFDADYVQNVCYKECCDELERLKIDYIQEKCYNAYINKKENNYGTCMEM